MTFKSGQVLSIRNSWAEMNEREVVSVVFQGQKAGGKIQRLFRVDGIDATSIDSCELYSQENGFPVNRTIIVEVDETMGRTRSAKNFALVLEDKEAPLNIPSEAHTLMKIIDGVYASAKSGRPVEIRLIPAGSFRRTRRCASGESNTRIRSLSPCSPHPSRAARADWARRTSKCSA